MPARESPYVCKLTEGFDITTVCLLYIHSSCAELYIQFNSFPGEPIKTTYFAQLVSLSTVFIHFPPSLSGFTIDFSLCNDMIELWLHLVF